MNHEQYERRLQELVYQYNIGEDNTMFAKLRSQAYERGHSAGYEEVLGILEDLIVAFEEELMFVEKRRYYEDAEKTLQRAGYKWRRLPGSDHLDWYKQ